MLLDGQEYGTGSARRRSPYLSRNPPCDIRLGDMLVNLPEGESPGLAAYDIDKKIDTKGFQPLRSGHGLATTKTVV